MKFLTFVFAVLLALLIVNFFYQAYLAYWVG